MNRPPPPRNGSTADGKVTAAAKFGVVIPAAGLSARYGANKLAEPIAGRSVLAWSIGAFIDRSDVCCVAIVTRDEAAVRRLLGPLAAHAKLLWAEGGDCRAQSAVNGANALPPDVQWIAVHDGARPLVSQRLIDRVFEAARTHGAAGPALPVALTIKEIEEGSGGRVVRTVPREGLVAMQTPQAMTREALLNAAAQCPLPLPDVTDDLQLLELCGYDAVVVEGEARNLKLTTPDDLWLAQRWAADDAMVKMRTPPGVAERQTQRT